MVNQRINIYFFFLNYQKELNNCKVCNVLFFFCILFYILRLGLHLQQILSKFKKVEEIYRSERQSQRKDDKGVRTYGPFLRDAPRETGSPHIAQPLPLASYKGHHIFYYIYIYLFCSSIYFYDIYVTSLEGRRV